MKVCFILGTKAELIKTAPVMKELEKRGYHYSFVHTGQHSLGDICDDFEIKKPDVVLDIPPTSSSKFMVKTYKALLWLPFLIPRIRRALNKVQPDFVFYHGDTMSAAAAAFASSRFFGRKKWLNGHLEAGLRSGSLFEPFPEEISRRICDHFSDLLFAPSELSMKNIAKLKGKAYMTGNTIVDSIYHDLEIAKKRKLKNPKGEYVVVNVHRHENIKSKERMRKIVDVIKEVGLPMIWPLHDNTKKQLEKFGFMGELKKLNIQFSPLKTYIEFLWLLNGARYFIVDGGSIQEESLALKKPAILLRNMTERQEGLLTPLNYLTRLDWDYSKRIIREIESGRIKTQNIINPYGDGTASKQIIDIVLQDRD